MGCDVRFPAFRHPLAKLSRHRFMARDAQRAEVLQRAFTASLNHGDDMIGLPTVPSPSGNVAHPWTSFPSFHRIRLAYCTDSLIALKNILTHDTWRGFPHPLATAFRGTVVQPFICWHRSTTIPAQPITVLIFRSRTRPYAISSTFCAHAEYDQRRI